tara:strand:- start:198 stop:485 length:288 start_codon:yes stop_codon:yes gene_type:complete
MPKGYLIASIVVHDKEGFEEFKRMSGPVISEYGGKILVRNPNPEIREGKELDIAIVLEFESIESARQFYESEKYTLARKVREKASKTDLILVEGV